MYSVKAGERLVKRIDSCEATKYLASVIAARISL